jgi:hypothetical protein
MVGYVVTITGSTDGFTDIATATVHLVSALLGAVRHNRQHVKASQHSYRVASAPNLT